MTCLDFPFVYSFQYRVNQCLGSLREWYLTDDESLLVEFLYLRTYLDDTATLSVIVFRYIDTSASGEVWIESEVLSMQIGNGGITDLHEVMRKNLCG